MNRNLTVLLLALALCALAAAPAQAAPTPSGFDLEGFHVTYTAEGEGLGGEGGPVETRAGAHPFALITSFGVPGHTTEVGGLEGFIADEAAKDVLTAQIEGLGGEPAAVAPCPRVQFLTRSASEGKEVPDCPDSSAVGYVDLTIANETAAPSHYFSALYNLAPPPGQVAEYGFWNSGVPVQIDAGLSESPPYRVLAGSRNISQIVEVVGAKVVLWGVPAAEAHDPLRGSCLRIVPPSQELSSKGTCSAGGSPTPFLTMPRACRGALGTAYAADSWPHPGALLADGEPDLADPAWARGEVGLAEDPQGMVACSRLPFSPSIGARATTAAASAASGLDFSLEVPDPGIANPDPEALAASDIEKTVVTLPRGMTLNPSEAEGLVGCSEAELARERSDSAFGSGCPAASKVGTIEVETPLLPETVLHGQLYVAEPYANPFGSLVAVYVVISDPGLGIKVVQPLEVSPDPRTGQLVSTASEMPQLPFSHFRLHFREGARAPLITPPGCGTHTTTATLYPWSGGPPVTSTSDFQITAGPGGGPCPSGAPFSPGFEAGSLGAQAGSFSPFVMHLTRQDGEQDMGKFSFVLPPGVVPRLAGIPYCPEAAHRAGAGAPGRPRRRRRAAAPLLPRGQPDRPHARRRGRGQPAHPRARPPLPRRPLPRRPDLGGLDHPGGRRPLRRGHRRRARGAAAQPGDPRRRSRRLRLGPDPPHPQGHPAEPARAAGLRRPPRLHPRPDLLRVLRGLLDDLGGRHRAGTARPPPGRPLLPLPGGQLRQARLQAAPQPAPQGRHPPRRLPRPQSRLRAAPPRRRQPLAPRAHLPELGVHRTGPLPHDLHPRAVRRRERLRRKVPQGLDLRARSGLDAAAR